VGHGLGQCAPVAFRRREVAGNGNLDLTGPKGMRNFARLIASSMSVRMSRGSRVGSGWLAKRVICEMIASRRSTSFTVILLNWLRKSSSA
jgi:hypothetical protein